MPTGPIGKGPRLWLQPERERAAGVEQAVWVIRDGKTKRSTGCGPADRRSAEQALARYLAEKYEPAIRNGDPSQVLTADIIALYARDIAPAHARPKETGARVRRLISWWTDPEAAMQSMHDQKLPAATMTGTIADVRTATCKAYVTFVGATRSAQMDLELMRAAINHAHREQLLDRPVPVWTPPKSLPRERWLTRDEVAKLVWAAWRHRRSSNGRSGAEDEWGSRKHLARWILIAAYTGTRKTAILNASFERAFGRGHIDLDAGLWHRRGAGVRATKKRQPPIPLPGPLLAHMRRWQKNGQKFAVEFYGKPVERMDKAFRLLVADCKLHGEKVVPHTLRHTSITWAMQAGMDPWAAAGYFGLNLQTLTENYGHHHPAHLREAMERMARARHTG
jgi:integrase